MKKNNLNKTREPLRRFSDLLIIKLLVFCGFLCGCSSSNNSSSPAPEPVLYQNPYSVGDSINTLSIGEVSRKFLLYRPATVNQPKALVVVLHGGGGTGINVANPGEHPLSVFRAVADSNDFVLVYPEGSLDVQGNPGWNDCRSDAPAHSSADDLSFLHALILKLQAELQLTSSETFLAGTSNGAVMTFAYTFHFPSTLKAIAVSSGNLPALPKAGACSVGPTIPIPIMLTYGTEDPAMPVNGGCVANFGGLCNRGTVISQQETLNFWLSLNGLTGVTPISSIIDINFVDQGPAQRFFYSGNTSLLYFKLNGAGHPVPSASVLTDYSPTSGFQNRDIEFAEEAWKFFEAL